MTETRSGLGGWINERDLVILFLSLSLCLYLCQEIQWHSVFSALERISFLDDIVIINRAHERGTWNGKACDRDDDSVRNFLEEGLASRHVNLIAEKSKRFEPEQPFLYLFFFQAFLSKNLFILHDDSLLNPEINEILDTKKKKKIEFNLFKVKKEYRSIESKV